MMRELFRQHAPLLDASKCTRRLVVGASLLLCACGSSPGTLSGTHVIRETLTGTINAVTSPVCSDAFRLSVDPSYYAGGTRRCQEFRYRSTTAGMITRQSLLRDRDLLHQRWHRLCACGVSPGRRSSVRGKRGHVHRRRRDVIHARGRTAAVTCALIHCRKGLLVRLRGRR